jgi:hypothetical protein
MFLAAAGAANASSARDEQRAFIGSPSRLSDRRHASWPIPRAGAPSFQAGIHGQTFTDRWVDDPNGESSCIDQTRGNQA